jgi:hypothetical protein
LRVRSEKTEKNCSAMRIVMLLHTHRPIAPNGDAA